MRIDLPPCGFKQCRFQSDGNCLYKSEYDRCEHRRMRDALESVIMTYNICCLCQTTDCQNSGKEDLGCMPIWNGLYFGAR